MGDGKRIGLYCSDVSGAFDRVSSDHLLQQLKARGISKTVLAVLSSWLGDRSAVVVVDGAKSSPSILANSVYQGTVLGPQLWNCFFEDARLAVNKEGFTETVFADDLNSFKAYNGSQGDADIYSDLQRCQQTLHKWGQANRVTFDPAKESFHILDRRRPSGDLFRFLGVTFDPQLVMSAACFEIAGQAHCRLRSLLRCKQFFSMQTLVRHYKSQVLSFIEWSTPAIHHAPIFFLTQIDRVQETFLAEIDLSAGQALMDFGLAPLQTRRDIAMMGLLFRIAKGRAPPQFNSVIRRAEAAPFPRNLRQPAAQHNLQFHDPIDGTAPRMMERSVLGLIYSFNMLPASMLELDSTNVFQRRLQTAVKRAYSDGFVEWGAVLRKGVRENSLRGYQQLFDAETLDQRC